MMNTRVSLKSCYVCHNPIFPEDKIAKKRIHGVDSTRHLWHRIPNSGNYFYNLADAKSFLEKIVNSNDTHRDGYLFAESRDILEDIERLEKIGF